MTRLEEKLLKSRKKVCKACIEERERGPVFDWAKIGQIVNQ